MSARTVQGAVGGAFEHAQEDAATGALRESEERYRQQSAQLAIILEGIADGVTAQRADGTLLYANDMAARSCGYPSAEAMMRAAPGEIVERFEAFDEHGARFDWALLPGRRALAGDNNASATLRIREKATGLEWWTTITARAVCDAHGVPYLAVNIWRDVTDQRRRELHAQFLAEATALLSSGFEEDSGFEQLARLMVPRVADCCAVHHADAGELRLVALAHADPTRAELARELQRRYPVDPAGLRGVANVVRSGRAELHAEISEQILIETARDPEQLATLRALGPRSAIVVPLRARRAVIGALSLISAESGRRLGPAELALAEELGRRAGLAAENARLYRNTKEAVKARDEFLSIAGHELKTPLAAMTLQIGGLQRLYRRGAPPEPPQLIERLQKIGNQAQRINRLVEQLLDVSRITSGRLKLELEAVELGELAQEVAARFTEEAARTGCSIELRSAGPVTGRWDRLRIDQVLTNLLSNALKYGGGKPVRIEIGAAPGRARIVVRDQGIGIAPEHHPRIFGRFERAVPERYYGGLGLGLWITRQIVEVHGGSIQLDSQPGEGSTFTIELPL